MKKILRLILSFALISLTASSSFAVVYGESGWKYSGFTEDTAWEINSAEVLAKVRDDINKGKVDYAGYYKLTKDIDLTSYTTWKPIGESYLYAFKGHFNGNGHTIKVNISRNSKSEDHLIAGLFGYIINGGSVKNLSVKGNVQATHIGGYYYVTYAAGISAFLYDGTITNCKFDGNISANSIYGDTYAGGITACALYDYYYYDSVFKITGCKVGSKSSTSVKSNSASGTGTEGGIVGYVESNSDSEISGNRVTVTLGGTCTNSAEIIGIINIDGGICKIADNLVVDPNYSDDPDDPEDPDDPDDPDDPIDEPDDSILKVSLDFEDSAELGDFYQGTATVSGGKTPYQWDYEGDLPTGLELKQNTNGTKATISGQTTEAGEFTFVLQVTDKNGETEEEVITITVTEPEPDELEISDSDFENSWSLKKPYSGTAKVTGGVAPYTWSVEGDLPTGLELQDAQDENWAEAEISGKPLKAGTYSFTLIATDSEGNSVETDEVIITITAPKISGTFEKSWLLKKSYSSYIKVSGGEAPYKASKSSGTLPNGLKLSVSGSKVYLKGTPSSAGKFSFKVKVKDNNGATVSKSYTVTITAPEISASFKNGTVGKTYSGTATVSGGTSPYIWKASGVPAGLELTQNAKGTKAYIKGKPTKAKTYTVKLTVTDKNKAKATKSLTFKINKKTSTAKAMTESLTPHEILNSVFGDSQGILIERIPLEVFEEDILSKGECKYEDLVEVKANQDLRFVIGERPGGISANEFEVYIDDKAFEVEISEEGEFTIPSEKVHDDFKVHAKAGTLETIELFISAIE